MKWNNIKNKKGNLLFQNLTNSLEVGKNMSLRNEEIKPERRIKYHSEIKSATLFEKKNLQKKVQHVLKFRCSSWTNVIRKHEENADVDTKIKFDKKRKKKEKK